MLTKKPDPVRNNYNFLQLAQASTSLLAEDVKNVHFDNDNPQGIRQDKTNKGSSYRYPDSKYFISLCKC